jgi:signal transduction histidine kinase
MSVVLLVEDSPTDRALFRAILSRGGFAVHEALYGRDVLPRLEAIRPLAVVLDVNLPDTDGHAVCRAIRAASPFATLPVLMLTVRDDERDVVAGLEAGADDYVAKDAAPAVILARLQRVIRYRQMAGLTLLNEQLVQIGRLLAGIVHEIRGPLSVIRGNAEMMSLTLGPAHEAMRWVGPILGNAEIMSARLEHLMAAVRAGPPELRPLAVGPVVREAADLFQRGTDPRKGKVTVRADLPEGLPEIRADAGRLLQVLLNLLVNAQEAVQAVRPDVRIEVGAALRQDDAGRWVTIDVHDDGPGIPEAHLGRLFEPFFTTKPTGSGYGLYLASEIAREHGGKLTACNRGEGGACFTLWLPVPGSGPAGAPAGGNGATG